MSTPFGDLEANPKLSNIRVAEGQGDGDSTVGLIRARPEQNHPEQDLSLAIIDLLSCCDNGMNSNQAKILQDMESRFQKNGNLIRKPSEQRSEEGFHDEPRSPMLGILACLSRFFNGQNEQRSSHQKTREFLNKGVSSKCSDRSKFVIIGACLCVTIIGSLVKNHFTGTFQPMEPPTTDCEFFASQKNPNVLTQCVCQGKITMIDPEIVRRYDVLLQAFGSQYLHEDETIESCSARNQALVWLADDSMTSQSEHVHQRHALATFFIQLKGLEWNLENGQQWLTPDHECSWYGVTCNDDQEVTALELWNMNLKGPLPSTLGSLSLLEKLSLPENKLEGTLPSQTLAMLTNLTDLTLFMNSISGTIGSEFLTESSQLETLNLDSNNIFGFLPTNLGHLTNLKKLKLARNSFEGSLPTELGDMKQLRQLELEENILSGSLPSEIGRIRMLESINVSYNKHSGGIPWHFQELRHLKDLFLKSNQFSGTLPKIMMVWENLENLVMSLNMFTGELPIGLSHMSALQTLHIEGNKLSGTLANELGACTNLRDIKLSYNHFTGTVPETWGKLSELISMNLEGNKLNGQMPEEVCSLRQGKGGILQSLSATCVDDPDNAQTSVSAMIMTQANHEQVDLICSIPDCCTQCETEV